MNNNYKPSGACIQNFQCVCRFCNLCTNKLYLCKSYMYLQTGLSPWYIIAPLLLDAGDEPKNERGPGWISPDGGSRQGQHRQHAGHPGIWYDPCSSRCHRSRVKCKDGKHHCTEWPLCWTPGKIEVLMSISFLLFYFGEGNNIAFLKDKEEKKIHSCYYSAQDCLPSTCKLPTGIRAYCRN